MFPKWILSLCFSHTHTPDPAARPPVMDHRLLEWIVFQYFQVPRLLEWIVFQYFQDPRLLEWIVFQYFQDHRLLKWIVFQYFQVPKLSNCFVFQYFQDYRQIYLLPLEIFNIFTTAYR